MSSLKLAIISDGRTAPRFMLDALRRLDRCDEVTVFACTNTRHKRRVLKHGLYYALSLWAVRNPMTRPVPLETCGKRIVRITEFESPYEGAWQHLPDEIVDALAEFDVVLKIGMGLLKVPPADRLATPILSYHHGDPSVFRGRPAGFWEMMTGAPVMGQVVQRLSNALDAGAVLAFAQTKVWPHSWRATLVEAYRHSPLLLNEAVRNALGGASIDKPASGRNYRLPSNLTVLGFMARMTARFARRLAYGALVEKAWRVSRASIAASPAAIASAELEFPPAATWHNLEPENRHSFYADPFFSAAPPGLLVEAMSRRTGLGEIILVEGERRTQVSPPGQHFSYPCAALVAGEQVVVPETAVSSPATAYRLVDGAMKPLHVLDIGARDGLIDPTLHVEAGRVYLFANLLSIGPSALFLWSSPALEAPFLPHPLSPVLVSPFGGRMAGSLLRDGGRLIRLGQDLSGDYGDGLVAFEVEELGPATYRERRLGTLRFEDRRGPHTLNAQQDELVFDWYRQRITPLAGLRRLLAHQKSRSG